MRATGRTGKWVLKEALDHGHMVHALVRNKTKIEPNAHLVVFEGSPSDEELLAKARSDCNAIISVLNISRMFYFPWAKPILTIGRRSLAYFIVMPSKTAN